MDANLDESLNLDRAMGVDFDHASDNVVNQSDITLDASHESGIPMEFEHIEEHQMLMDTGNEEIIVSDFMGDQIGLQEYDVQDNQIIDSSIPIEHSHHHTVLTQPEELNNILSVSASDMLIEETPKKLKKKIIQVKAAPVRIAPAKKETIVLTKTTAPRQVAIAPKPSNLNQFLYSLQKMKPGKVVTGPQQYALAPKPLKAVTMVNRPVSLMKKTPMSTATVTSGSQGKAVLTQIGKQLVVVPAGGSSQKIKLVTSSGTGMPTVRFLSKNDAEQSQVNSDNATITQGSKPVIAKVIVQGQTSEANQSAVLTKLLPSGSNVATTQLKYVTMQQKTVPISIANNKVVVSSPTKQGMRFGGKKQIIAIKSPTGKVMSSSAPSQILQTTGKKVVISASQAQNLVLKTATVSSKSGVVTKIGPKSQLHQINVPGKGIQYIRLVTNPTQSIPKAVKVSPKAVTTGQQQPGKTFVLTDSKGNMIQMNANKIATGQPPPLVLSGNINKLTSKPQQKLVRIAPLSSKPGQTAIQQARSGQSLLAPLSPGVSRLPSSHDASYDASHDSSHDTAHDASHEISYDVTRNTSYDATPDASYDAPDASIDAHEVEVHVPAHMPDLGEFDVSKQHVGAVVEESESKAALRALIADAVADEPPEHDTEQLHQHYDEQDNSMASEAGGEGGAGAEHPLIVIPAYCKQEAGTADDSQHMDHRNMSSMINVEVEAYHKGYQSPPSPQYRNSESELIQTELGLRPRKACNCTKSQCLKLYCDCFANGEFCNRCNCNNCHNNLENEELRQKAIRGCLDRNPNAFRPKIGKAKSGGPDIRRHNKGCNCKRSGCLKNYCECYEAKIACTAICKCVGCRNVEDTVRAHHAPRARPQPAPDAPQEHDALKQPCSFMTCEVIEAVCQCLVAAAGERAPAADPVADVIEEFARCLQDIISAAHHATPASANSAHTSLSLLDEAHA